MKKQIVFIHGGETFDTYESYLNFLDTCGVDPYEEKEKRWKDGLAENLGEDWEVFLPLMPSKFNAKYVEWKVWFEKYFSYLHDEVILIGHSLGGVFLAKFLSENQFPVKIKAVYVLAGPFWTKEDHGGDETADFLLPETLNKLENQTENIFLYHSKDDPVVPFSHSLKYKKSLPNAKHIVLEDRGHFLTEGFQELEESIKSL